MQFGQGMSYVNGHGSNMLMDHYMLHVQESVNLTIYLYAQTMGQQRMLYIRKFYVVKNI